MDGVVECLAAAFVPGALAFAVSFGRRWGVRITLPITLAYFLSARASFAPDDALGVLQCALPMIAAVQGAVAGDLYRRLRNPKPPESRRV